MPIQGGTFDIEIFNVLINHYELIEPNLVEIEKYCIVGMKLKNIANYDFNVIYQKLNNIYAYKRYDLYNLLKNIQDKNELIRNKIKRLKENKKIKRCIAYDNMLVYDECIICFQYEKCVTPYPKCINHKVCFNCYLNIDKCPYKCPT